MPHFPMNFHYLDPLTASLQFAYVSLKKEDEVK